MTFSIVAALLTLGACLAVLVPIVRARDIGSADALHDVEVYQDQLAELDRDLARGAIADAEAQEARAEIGRRLLKAAAKREGTAGRSKVGQVVATVAILAVPLASWSIYAATGSPHLPAQPLHARLANNPANASVDELIARAEAHLSANPDDGRGWDVLAPIYLRMGRYEDAANALTNAIRLLGSTADREVALAEALAGAANGSSTPAVLEALERALTLEPKHERARFLLGAAFAQEGRTAEASRTWQSLLADLPEESPGRGVVTQALANLGGSADKQAESGGEDLILDKDQAAMIDNMVAGLDQRLRDNPADAEGWQRLVHSYAVLGKAKEAEDALARGTQALGQESEAALALVEFAAARGVKLKGVEGE